MPSDNEIRKSVASGVYSTNKEKKLSRIYKGRTYYKQKNLAPRGSQFRKAIDDYYNTPDAIDLYYEKPMYGRVDQNNDFVYPRNNKMADVQSIERISEGNKHVMVLDFVAKAFKDMSAKVAKMARAGSLSMDGKLLPGGKFEPAKGYVDIAIGQNAFLDIFIDRYNNQILVNRRTSLQEKNKITNIQVYYEKMIGYIELTNFKITKSGRLGSSRGGIQNTGLAIEVAEVEYGDDVVNLSEFIYGDQNFTKYRHLAREYGFAIDKNAPYRLIADLGSPVMEDYMAMYGTNIDMLFKTHYRLASAGDIQELRNVILNGYNNFASSNKIMRDIKCKVYHDSIHKAAASSTFCPIEDINVITVSTISQRETETMATMVKKLPLSMWYQAYFRIRHTECGSPFDEPEKNRHLINIEQMMEVVDKGEVVRYINRVLKPYMVDTLSQQVATIDDAARTTASPGSNGASAPSGGSSGGYTSSGGTSGGSAGGGSGGGGGGGY